MANALISKFTVGFAVISALFSSTFLNAVDLQAQISTAIVRNPASTTIVKVIAPKSLTINQNHLFRGEINRKGLAGGYHHRTNGKDSDRARLVNIVSPANSQGVYVGRVEVLNPATGKWIRKVSTSTFFPDRWSQSQVLSEIQSAFSTVNPPTERWQGTSPSGLRIEGYYNRTTNTINTAYPVYRR